jgi:hypothetical protein
MYIFIYLNFTTSSACGWDGGQAASAGRSGYLFSTLHYCERNPDGPPQQDMVTKDFSFLSFFQKEKREINIINK